MKCRIHCILKTDVSHESAKGGDLYAPFPLKPFQRSYSVLRRKYDEKAPRHFRDKLNDGTFRYFLFPVAKSGGALMVAGNAVSEAGWYTFGVRFREVDGHLAVDFELAQNGKVL